MMNMNLQQKISYRLSMWAILLAFCYSYSSYGSSTTVSDSLEWLIQTFEQNDAGASYIIEEKGRSAYEAHNQKFRELAKSVTSKSDCAQLMRDWLTFFRKGHHYVEQLNTGTGSFDEPTVEEIQNRYVEWPRVDLNEQDARAIVDSIPRESRQLIGIWQYHQMKIAIIPATTGSANDLVGVVLQSNDAYWTEGQVMMEIQFSRRKIVGTSYRKDRLAESLQNAYVVGNNYFVQNNRKWKRVYPLKPDLEKTKEHFEIMSSAQPFLEQVWEQTVLLRIPSFDQRNKGTLERLLADNRNLLERSKNLIIDIRGNGGGSDWTWECLIPYLATYQVRFPNNQFLSTPTNIETISNALQRATSAESKRFLKAVLSVMQQSPNQFVSDGDEIIVSDIPRKKAFPQRVAVMIDENVASSAESFIWFAKQSHKTKIYGIKSAGMLDASNIFSTDSPTRDFRLYYALSRCLLLPEYEIDDYGFQPDFYLDHTIPRERWIDFVIESLESQQ